MTTKSPFYIVNQFISPLQCEDIIYTLNNKISDVDKKYTPIKNQKTNVLLDNRLMPLLKNIIPTLEQYYNFNYKGTLPFSYEWFVEGYAGNNPICENSNIISGKWRKTKDNDFTGILFLNSYNDSPDFDTDYEVYGGKLEFPNHSFSFKPVRGQLIIFPSVPNFINSTDEILAGELHQIRFHIASTETYVYTGKNFPGNYTSWFK